jgi:primosomal protein N'
MADFEKFDDCPNCHAKATAFTFRNIYQCHDCGRHYCDKCSASNYSCPHCRSHNIRKMGEAH